MKDFQQLVNKQILTNILLDVNKIPTGKEEAIKYLINQRLITKSCEVEYVKKWWDDPESNLPEPTDSEVHTTENGVTAKVFADNPATPEKEQDPVITTSQEKTSSKKTSKK